MHAREATSRASYSGSRASESGIAQWLERAVVAVAVALAIAGIVVGAETNQTAIAGGLIALAPGAGHRLPVGCRRGAPVMRRKANLTGFPFTRLYGRWRTLRPIISGPVPPMAVLTHSRRCRPVVSLPL